MALLDKSIVDIMLLQYDSFTAAEKKIVDYVLAHQKESQYISITELSAACNVAISTVSVFCRKLKLSGFNDFKIELARADTTASPVRTVSGAEAPLRVGDSTGEVMRKVLHRSQETLHRTAHLLEEHAVDRAVEILADARRVLLLGQGDHAAVADEAWMQFSLLAPKFQTLSDSHLQRIALSTLTEEDAVLYFSYAGATPEVLEAAEIVRRVGARMILVTRFLHAPAAECADVLLQCGVEERPLPYRSVDELLSQLYVIEVLAARYRLMDESHTREYRERIGELLEKRRP